MGTWDVNPLEHDIYLRLYLNLHPLSHRKISPVMDCWGNARHPLQVEFGIFMFFSVGV